MSTSTSPFSDAEVVFVEAFRPERVVDTLGAGDTFIAAVIHKLHRTIRRRRLIHDDAADDRKSSLDDSVGASSDAGKQAAGSSIPSAGSSGRYAGNSIVSARSTEISAGNEQFAGRRGHDAGIRRRCAQWQKKDLVEALEFGCRVAGEKCGVYGFRELKNRFQNGFAEELGR